MKTFFASFFGVLSAVFFLIVLVVVLAVGLSIGSSSGDATIEKGTFLVLNINGAIPDRIQKSSFPKLAFLSGDEDPTMSLSEILFTLKKVEKDARIQGILLNAGNTEAGYATLREIRNALKRVKKSGKKVYSYSEVYTQKGYYVASVSDSLVLHPEGLLELSGIGSNRLYLKGLLDKAGIKAELVRGSNNAYKSAGEPYIAERMSDANREQTTVLLMGIWSTIRKDLAKDGRLTSDALDSLIRVTPLFRGVDAVRSGLMEAALYEDEFYAALHLKESKEDRLVAFEDYTDPSGADASEEKENSSLERIAVVYAEGDIESGEGSDGVVCSETFVEALREIRGNKHIKAVVLRINSPGGSALASDVMWREVMRLKQVKPVIVSMGNVAASGGYYLAAPGTRIFAQPITITGSIGVFGLFFTGEGLLNDKLGVRYEPVGTHPFSSFGQLDRSLTDAERLLIQHSVDQTYGRFLQVVSRGRGLDSLLVDSLGRGRVWTGTDAHKLGLVDAEGGLMDAIAYAQRQAGLSGTPRISAYPKEVDPIEKWIEEFSKRSATNQWKELLGPVAGAYTEWTRWAGMNGIQMRLTEVNPLLN